MSRIILVFSFIVTISSKCLASDLPSFRILAPQLICPKDENSPIEKQDNTVITIQPKSDLDFDIHWVVRWQPLHTPTQRFTLMVWRTVRALEAKLNAPQPEPFIFVINDDELLYGVNYIFDVKAKSLTGEESKPKSFYINNTFGDTTLEAVDGRTDIMMSVVLVGSQNTYADISYVLEAEVTTCVLMYDYHFIWKIKNEDIQDTLNISATGSRVEIPSHSLQPGLIYDITCYIIKDVTAESITQIELPLEVGHRGLEVRLNVDRLIVTIHNSFILEATVINHDYFAVPVTLEWLCFINGSICDFFDGTNESYFLSTAFPSSGEYEITVITSVLHQSAEARATIIAIDSFLPVIQVEPTSRVLNKGATLSVVANVSNIMPTCTLTWYFATQDELDVIAINVTANENQHGTPISDTVAVYSLEENFLSEIADYSNETEWRQVSAETQASAGRARFVVQCNCSSQFDCGSQDTMYADVYFTLNEGPIPKGVTISPPSGTALETIFRISTLAATDPDGPLRYTFHCSIGRNETVILGSYLEHMAMETFLPYVEGGTEVWVEVCDILEACTNSDPTMVHVLKGAGRSINILMAGILAHIKRCELIQLQRAAISAIVTYSNAGQTEPLAMFGAFLAGSLPTLPMDCISETKYLDFLNKLAVAGMDISGLNTTNHYS